jgi:hypothetical protein
MKRVVNSFLNSDVVLIIRALLFTAVAAVVIGIVVLSLHIERLIKFLRRFAVLSALTLTVAALAITTLINN